MDLEGASPARRRRGPELEDALLDAAWEEVTARAGTSRPVVYRRWPAKRDLVLATVRHRGARSALGTPDTGSLRDDLIALLSELDRSCGAQMLLLGAEAGEFHRDTGLTPDDLREQWLGDRSAAVRTVIDRAAARGEVDPARITARTVRLATDLLRHEMLMTMRSVPDDAVRQIVDEVVLPVLTGSVPRT
jgi:AcrR family transcriptional regulator